MERRTPLLETHRKMGARLVEFAGWEMPLQYEGVIAEHRAVREGIGCFDVSHLGKLRVVGEPGPLQRAVTADVEALEVGRARYALVLTDDAGCIDDVFVYRTGPSEWLVVPNAANVGAVAAAIADAGGTAEDLWDRWAIIALQGPRSFELFESLWPGTGASDLKLHRWITADLGGIDVMVARTGYTGERGYELYVPSSHSLGVFTALVDAGATPAGLGARDTLRLEMGYALYGHELALDIDPLEAGLGWAVAWDTTFRGREALAAVRAAGPARRLVGIRCTGRGVPRQGYPVRAEGEVIGSLTSGNYSPTLGVGIGLALCDAGAVPPTGGRVAIEARSKLIEGDIVDVPFVRR